MSEAIDLRPGISLLRTLRDLGFSGIEVYAGPMARHRVIRIPGLADTDADRNRLAAVIAPLAAIGVRVSDYVSGATSAYDREVGATLYASVEA